MLNIPNIGTEQLSSKAHKVLLAMLREGAFDKIGKLPQEEILAQKFWQSLSLYRVSEDCRGSTTSNKR